MNRVRTTRTAERCGEKRSLGSGLGFKVPPPSDSASAPPSLFTAIQQEIGLELKSGKAQVDILVIDSVSKPSEN